jgi:hypothetical protein
MKNNWSQIRTILILIVIIILALFLFSYISKKCIEGFSKIPNVEFPFKNVKNGKGENLNIIAISAPFREEKHEKLYETYKSDGLSFIGISSYLNFPEKIYNPYEDRFHEKKKHDYLKMVSSWVYCTREPSTNMKNSKLPLLQLTEADMKDTDAYTPDKSIKKEYDFMYVCLDDNQKCKPGWQSYNRNWDLAKKCLKVMCSKHNLSGLIVGRTNCKITDLCSKQIKFVPFMEFKEFQKTMQKCRFLFVPNIADASPRVITEALCYNMPVLVNEKILGGWHNIIPDETGEFFTNELNVSNGINKITNTSSKYKPRKWFLENRGIHSRKKFADFLKQNYGDVLSDTNLTEAFI